MESKFDQITSRLGDYISNRRIEHTIGVYRCARWLGSILLPDRTYDLSVAALLHDIAKELPREEMMKLIGSEYPDLDKEDLETIPALHSFAGAALAKRDFPDLINDDILSAIYNHTLGHVGMSLFDKIIFISDYIEEGRTATPCIEVREKLKGEITADHCLNLRALDDAIIMSIEHTERFVRLSGGKMNSKSLAFMKSLVELKQNAKNKD